MSRPPKLEYFVRNKIVHCLLQLTRKTGLELEGLCDQRPKRKLCISCDEMQVAQKAQVVGVLRSRVYIAKSSSHAMETE